MIASASSLLRSSSHLLKHAQQLPSFIGSTIGEERGMSIFVILRFYLFSSLNVDSVIARHASCCSSRVQFILCLNYDLRVACWSSPRNLTPGVELFDVRCTCGDVESLRTSHTHPPACLPVESLAWGVLIGLFRSGLCPRCPCALGGLALFMHAMWGGWTVHVHVLGLSIIRTSLCCPACVAMVLFVSRVPPVCVDGEENCNAIPSLLVNHPTIQRQAPGSIWDSVRFSMAGHLDLQTAVQLPDATGPALVAPDMPPQSGVIVRLDASHKKNPLWKCAGITHHLYLFEYHHVTLL